MVLKKFFKALFLSFILILNVLVIFSSKYAYSYEFYGWGHGAAGYDLAYSGAVESEKPLILYFHIESSIWNKRMNEEYLANYFINKYLEDIPRVEINPDKGGPEEKLRLQYEIEALPAFLVLIPSINKEFNRIHPFGEAEMSVNEFLNTLKETISYGYNALAYSYFEKKNYDTALKYYGIAAQYNPESAYIYYAIGTLYNYMYHNENKNPEFLKKAAENFQKALELDPDHAESKTELDKLKK